MWNFVLALGLGFGPSIPSVHPEVPITRKTEKRKDHPQMTPRSDKLPEDAISLISCGFAGQSTLTRYHVWLPKGYQDSKTRKYAFLFVDNDAGEGRDKWDLFRSWAMENEVICVMPVEIKDGDIAPIMMHYEAIFDDLPKRFRLASGSGIFTGFAGGARRVGMFSPALEEYTGGVLMCGAGAPNQHATKTKHIFGATLLGDHDPALSEMQLSLDDCGKRGYCRYLPAGKSWYDQESGAEALDWLSWRIASRSKPAAPDEILLRALKRFLAEGKGNGTALQRHQGLSRCADILKAHPRLASLPACKNLPAEIDEALKKIARIPGFAKESEAMKQFRGSYQKYCIEGLAKVLPSKDVFQGAPDIESIKKLAQRPNQAAIKEMQRLAKEFSGTEAAKLALDEVKRLEAFTKGW
ncbi:MAG: hypothetical protein RL095_3407 [Verrucomicrobiota bacterium]|jgi:hypothetical protein